MSDLEQLSNIIDIILSKDNDSRRQSEGLLKTLKENDLNKYCYTFATLLAESNKIEVRMFCAVHLRISLSNFSDSTLDPGWAKLNGDTQRYIKQMLFEVMNREADNSVRKGLADLIGEIGATMDNITAEVKAKMHPEGVEWKELMPTVMQYIMSGDTNFIQSGLKIMAVLFMYSGELYSQYKEDLYTVFKSNIEHNDFFVKCAAIEALSCYLEVIEPKQCKYFVNLIPVVFLNTATILEKNEDLGVEALGHIQDIVETEPKLIKPHYKDFFDTVKTINQMKLDSGQIKETALETFVLFLERLPKFGTNHTQILKEFIELVFVYMVACDEDPDEEWYKPKEGYVETNEKGDSDDGSIRLCMHLIDRLIACIGEKVVIPILSKIMLDMVKVNDWRYKHSALMALSQVGEYVQDISEMDPIVQFILNFFSDDHPKVRYAALHAVGQISDDMNPEFQIRFHNVILPPLVQRFQDPVPRVVSHCLAALTNFLEGSPKAYITEHTVTILEPSLQFIENGISLVKENAMSAISALAEACESDFTPYWQKTAEIIFNVLRGATQKEYKQLRGQAIECLTLIGVAVGKEEFKKAAHEIIQCMLEIQTNHVEESDPQKSYLLSGWQRICVVLGDDFVPYLEEILPSLFDLVENVIKADEKRQTAEEDSEAFVVNHYLGKKEETGPKLNVNTSETEELQLALNMINAFVVELKRGYLPYVQRTSDIIVPLLGYSMNDEIRHTAGKGLPALINVIQESKHANSAQIIKTMATKYIQALWETIEGEMSADTMAKLVYCIREVILSSGKFMTESEIEDLSGMILKALKDSDDRKAENAEYANDEDMDEDDLDALKDENDTEEELHCALAELIGALFHTHKELTLPLVGIIYNQILPKVLSPDLSSKMHKFGLFLIDDMIEFLGIELIPNEWPHLSEALLKFATDKAPEVRQAAVYGIGVLAEKSSNTFKEMSEYCVKALVDSLSIKKTENETDKSYGHARDNSVASLGKVIKCQAEYLPNLGDIVKVWLDHLPLKWDKNEARVQHELLVDIILASNASLVFGEKGENMQHVIQIFAEIVNTKVSTETIKNKIIQVINLLVSNQATSTLVTQAVGKLDAKWQNKLKEIMG